MDANVSIESYSRLKNLKLVELETGIKWQTVYTHLKKAGVAVTGVCGQTVRWKAGLFWTVRRG